MDRHVPRFTRRHRRLGSGSRDRRLELPRTAALRGDPVHGLRGVKKEGRRSSQAEYEKERRKRHVEQAKLQEWVEHKGLKVGFHSASGNRWSSRPERPKSRHAFVSPVTQPD